MLQVASSLYDWGGIERYVVFLAAGLRDRGHHVEIVAPPNSPITRMEGSVLELGLQNKLDLRGLAKYVRLFRQERFDVIHGHYSPDFVVPAYAARLTKQPLLVMTRHLATSWSRPKARLYSKLWHRIIPVSHAVERRLREAGISANQMMVAKAGMPEPFLRSTAQETRLTLGIGPKDFVVGSFSRLSPEKGVDVFVRALGLSKGTVGCVFGDGSQRQELEDLARGKPIRFFGQIPDVSDAMKAMDAVVIPSLWEEPFPFSALEAMALGRPLLASDIGGLPEMIDGQNGWLFKTGSAEILAEKISLLATDPQLRTRLGAHGRARFEREFTVGAMAERIEAVYLAGPV